MLGVTAQTGAEMFFAVVTFSQSGSGKSTITGFQTDTGYNGVSRTATGSIVVGRPFRAISTADGSISEEVITRLTDGGITWFLEFDSPLSNNDGTDVGGYGPRILAINNEQTLNHGNAADPNIIFARSESSGHLFSAQAGSEDHITDANASGNPVPVQFRRDKCFLGK